MIWRGGLSFHGGFLGVILGLWFFGGRTFQGLLRFGDAFALYTPIGLGLGRLGNFMNSELVGRPTNGSWGMIFERVDQVPRHPSQLYEAVLEGLVLFLILKFISRKTRETGVLFWSFIGCYGIFRFLVEFFREPDSQIGFVWGPFSLGQLLSLPMIFIAVTLALTTAFQGKQ
jgi:phosphatidylglycerol:prolipoprotein diacylglycerol transferase